MSRTSSVFLLQLSRVGFTSWVPKLPLYNPGPIRLPPASSQSSVLSARLYSHNDKTRSYLHYLKRKVIPRPRPPFSHVCQVGDPVLRSQAAAVDPAAIRDPEIQHVIRTLVKVMRSRACVGLSAPQIGVPLRILAIEYTQEMLEKMSPESREARGLSVQPLRVFVNPRIRVLDARMVLFDEGCDSISGFAATVPRYLSVEVSGLNEEGEAVTWRTSGWPARILQHEMDHLEGVLFIDRMDSKTFINRHWQQLND
ncbi:peptide deformylase, mitochondrial isoform X2 [Thalassophryne amazonica]|nr:peptide deformylase, mitochondrial isoform X2 [Thalassophryne amazonica]